MNPITEALEELILGQMQAHGNLALFQLISRVALPAAYITLDEVLERGAAVVSEISEGGSVPELRFDNYSGEEVFLLDGEELVGARQNRVLNLSLLVGANSKIVIPVSCVERGRWSYASRDFRSAKRVLYSRARAAKMSQVSASLRRSGTRYSDQHAVWADIANKVETLNCYSPTEAMADLYEHTRPRLDSYVNAFQPISEQVGAVFCINGRVAGAECFDSPDTFKKLLQKLVCSYAMDAIETTGNCIYLPIPEDVNGFLNDIKSSKFESFKALGEGNDYRLRGRDITGAALVTDGKVIHLSALRATR